MATGNSVQSDTFTAPSGNSDGDRSDASGDSTFEATPSSGFKAKASDFFKGKPSPGNVRSFKAPKSESKPRVRTSDVGDYRETIKGILAIPAGALVMKYPADAATLIVNMDSLANAGQKIAEHDERAAALLEKLTEAGPYAETVALIATMTAQFLVNHGKLKAGIVPGTKSPDELIESVLGPANPTPPPGV